MQFKQLIRTGQVARGFYRNYVSSVSVNVKSLKSIRVKSRDFLEPSDEKVKLTVFDGSLKEVDVTGLTTVVVNSSLDEFKLDCQDGNDFSMVLEVPINSPEVEIGVKASSSDVFFENLQTKSIKIDVQSGDVSLKNLKSDLIKAETNRGCITTKSLLLGKKIYLEAEDGTISIEKTQGDSLEAKGSSISVDSCYSTNNKFKSSGNTVLKNIHGHSKIRASGDLFKLSGFSGLLEAQLNNKKIEIQLSELYGENLISSTNLGAVINLGLSEGIIGDTVVQIMSDCQIENLVPELIICQKKENSFEIKKENTESKNKLLVKVENGKHVELSKMSWIDSLKLSQKS